MTSEPVGPELSSMTASLEDLSRRIAALAEARVSTRQDWVAQELFEVERAVTEAVRRLDALGREVRQAGL